jgi:hypothetical protein
MHLQYFYLFMVRMMIEAPGHHRVPFAALIRFCFTDKCQLYLSILWDGPKKSQLFRVEKILATTVPLDTSGLKFQAGLGPGPGLGGPPMRM